MNKFCIAALGILALASVIAVGFLYVENVDDETPVPDSDREEVLNKQLNITGLTDGKVSRFKGIPYAEAPVGDLRFAPPVPKTPWTETLDCTEYGPSPVQLSSADRGPISEDCLHLNVWAPADAKPGDKLPVYVWIYGGAWLTGTGSLPEYDGSNYAADGVVAVTINYRLSTLGYLSLDILEEKYGTSGNFGMLDQILALEWVRDNISAFGGDSGNVTIGGESAGSVSVFNLVLCKQAEGLFQKAIMESGTVVSAFTPLLNCQPENALAMGKELMEDLGLKDSEEGLAELRKMDPMVLWNLCSLPADGIIDKPFAFAPLYDGKLLPREPFKALKEGDYNRDVKVIIGTNALEGYNFSGNFTSMYDVTKYLYRTWGGDDARAILEMYKGDPRSAYEIHIEVVGMTLFYVTATMAQDLMAANGTKVYAYEFEYTAEDGSIPKHAAEIVFPNENLDRIFEKPGDTDLKVSAHMHAMWTNFMKCGDPNKGLENPYGVEWGLYGDDRNVMHFDADPFFGKKTMEDKIDRMVPHFHIIG